MHHGEMTAVRTVPALCGVCSAACGIKLTLDADDRLVRLAPRQGHPRGIVCTRGTRAPEIVHSPDRWQHPMRRVGERGEGRFERISWDDAYAAHGRRDAADRGRARPGGARHVHGPRQLRAGPQPDVRAGGPARVVGERRAVPVRLAQRDRRRVALLRLDRHDRAARLLRRGVPRHRTRTSSSADLVLVWGANPATASPPANMRRLKAAAGARGSRRGHRPPPLGDRASRCAPSGSRSGRGPTARSRSGCIHLLVTAGTYDRRFVERWTHGFEELAAYAATFTPRARGRDHRAPRGCDPGAGGRGGAGAWAARS